MRCPPCASLSPDITVSVEQPGPNAATSNNIDHDIDMNMDSGGTCTRVVTDSCGTGAMQASSYYTASRCGAGQGLGGGFIVSPTCREPGTSTGNEMVNFSPNLVKAPSQTAGQADIVTTESGVANDTTRRTSSSHWQSSGWWCGAPARGSQCLHPNQRVIEVLISVKATTSLV